jgi:hypothetical protein
MGVEKFPMAKDSVHAYAFAERGVPLLELTGLEELAKDKVYEFAFIAAPLKLRGATAAVPGQLAGGTSSVPTESSEESEVVDLHGVGCTAADAAS